MARYIDVDKLIAEYDRIHIGPPGGARKLMVEAPTADVAEVVRCKDCKYYKPQEKSTRWENVKKYCNRVVTIKVSENDFCSYGERKR